MFKTYIKSVIMKGLKCLISKLEVMNINVSVQVLKNLSDIKKSDIHPCSRAGHILVFTMLFKTVLRELIPRSNRPYLQS